MSTASNNTRFTGRVKWFNYKTGFGFITITDNERAGEDIFVHHSAIVVGTEQYRYLVQGEYVSFSLLEVTAEGSEHKVQATEVSGVFNGKLMCETRKELRESRPPRQPRKQTDRPTQQRQNRPRQQRSRAPQQSGSQAQGQEQTVEWKLVQTTRPQRNQRAQGQKRPQNPRKNA